MELHKKTQERIFKWKKDYTYIKRKILLKEGIVKSKPMMELLQCIHDLSCDIYTHKQTLTNKNIMWIKVQSYVIK